VVNIKKLCEERLKGRYELNVIDLYQSPEGATEGEVVVAPTLFEQLPLPLRRLIGDLSDTAFRDCCGHGGRLQSPLCGHGQETAPSGDGSCF